MNEIKKMHQDCVDKIRMLEQLVESIKGRVIRGSSVRYLKVHAALKVTGEAVRAQSAYTVAPTGCQIIGVVFNVTRGRKRKGWGFCLAGTNTRGFSYRTRATATRALAMTACRHFNEGLDKYREARDKLRCLVVKNDAAMIAVSLVQADETMVSLVKIGYKTHVSKASDETKSRVHALIGIRFLELFTEGVEK